MMVEYRQTGLVLQRGGAGPIALVQALQRDLRQLGYLRSGLDGAFGEDTERAVRALRYDLLSGDGRGTDGTAPVAVRDFNGGRVTEINGRLDEPLAACMEALLTDARITPLPRSDDPAGENARVVETIRAFTNLSVPVPFLLAILSQESNLQHFRLPRANNPDDFIVVGLDRNDPAHRDRITSRGYGVGQFTLFHHPPTATEVQDVMLDPVKNAGRAVQELREKFTGFVAGPTSGTRADDRVASAGASPLRPCRYDRQDPRFQTDCRQCAKQAPNMALAAGAPVFPGSDQRLEPTQYHRQTHYDNLPDWKTFGCDWPYAVRRYNGSGLNSYHYQAQVLGRFLHDPAVAT